MKDLKEIVEEIRKEILNEEMSYCDLDNMMMEYDFNSLYDEGTVENVKEDGNAVYQRSVFDNDGIQIFFEVTKDREGVDYDVRITEVEYF